MKKITVDIQDDTLAKVTEILEDLGLDIENAVRMFFKRVIRDQSVAFVLPNTNGTVATTPSIDNTFTQTETAKIDRGEMRKSLAMKLFRERGRFINKNITYSSKNRSTYNYWANPDFSVLEQDWTLILNDWVNRKLYLFMIPAKSISQQELVARNDKPNLVDIQILEDNPSFIDKRSDYSFRRFLVDQIEY